MKINAQYFLKVVAESVNPQQSSKWVSTIPSSAALAFIFLHKIRFGTRYMFRHRHRYIVTGSDDNAFNHGFQQDCRGCGYLRYGSYRQDISQKQSRTEQKNLKTF